MSTREVTTMDAESAGVALVMSAQASPAGSGAGARLLPHAVASTVAIMTATDGSKPRGRISTKPTNSPITIRRDGRFAITNRCSESTLLAQVGCVERSIDCVVGERPALRCLVRFPDFAGRRYGL